MPDFMDTVFKVLSLTLHSLISHMNENQMVSVKCVHGTFGILLSYNDRYNICLENSDIFVFSRNNGETNHEFTISEVIEFCCDINAITLINISSHEIYHIF
jgi:hypothetical protein